MYLPFGLCSAPHIFNQLFDALEWLLTHNYGLQHVLHILNDFLVIEPSRAQCRTSFSTLLQVFMSSQAPLVASKTLGPSQVLEFMGMELECPHGSTPARGQAYPYPYPQTAYVLYTPPLCAVGRVAIPYRHPLICLLGGRPGADVTHYKPYKEGSRSLSPYSPS